LAQPRHQQPARLYRILLLLVLIAATWAFGAIAEDVVTQDPLTIIDLRFSFWLHAHTFEPLTTMMWLISLVHSTLSVTLMTLLVSVYLWKQNLRKWVFTLLLAVFGGMLLNASLKLVFARARPHFVNPIVTIASFSFPSGHTLMTTVFYGTLCALIWGRTPRWPGRIGAIAITGLMMLLVGFSRVYLGAHYLSDVIAAFAEGLAWIAFSLIAAEAISKRSAHLQDHRE
jgi:membrane-associated phospholipid phosphatase